MKTGGVIMRFKERMTVGRIIAFCIVSLLPLAVFGLGIFLLFGSICVNFPFILCYLILPLGCIAALFFLIFSKFASGAKILFSFVLLLAFVFLLLFMMMALKFELLDQYTGDKMSVRYAEHIENFNAMPQLSEVGDPESAVYYDYFSQMGAIFTCDADYLVCRYNREEYNTQKASVEERYVFQKEKLSASGYAIEPEISMDGYDFRLLSEDRDLGYDVDYPKCLIFIATNDDTCEIIYMSFYDDDLDWIESLEKFINQDCGWRWVKKEIARKR